MSCHACGNIHGKQVQMSGEMKSKAIDLYKQRRINEALEIFLQMRELEPGDNEILYFMGLIYLQTGRFDKATTCFSRIVEADSLNQDAYCYLGISLSAAGNYQQALAALQHALKINPTHMNAMMALASCHQMTGNMVGAIVEYRKIVAIYPENISAHIRMGDTCLAMGSLDDARNAYTRALELHPGEENAIAGLAGISQRCNDIDSANKLIRPLIDNNTKNVSVAIIFSEICGDAAQCNESIDRLNLLLRDESLTEDQRIKLLFALGSAYDKMYLYDKAFEAYAQGNRLIRVTYDPAAAGKVLDRYLNLWSSGLLQSLLQTGKSDNKTAPVFIIGMPRSGTSLVEQILASHPLVTACGELQLINNLVSALPSILKTDAPYPECIREAERDTFPAMAEWYLDEIQPRLDAGSIIFTDKAPLNFWHLGLVRLLFPEAKILHCVRNPLDNCLSNYFQNFTGRLSYASDLGSLGDYYLKYQRLMQHWKTVLDGGILDVRYENLVTGADETCSEILDFCGLPWDDRCLRHHETDRPVVTASYGQVFKPVYNTSLERWKNYDQHLAQLHKALRL
jgi:tetratricopeptide (TPR) repeat protein